MKLYQIINYCKSFSHPRNNECRFLRREQYRFKGNLFSFLVNPDAIYIIAETDNELNLKMKV